MKYIHALRIGQALKVGLIGVGFCGLLFFIFYLITAQIWKVLRFTLQHFVTLHPALSSPFGYLLGIILMLILIYILGIILSIKIHEESLIEKITALLGKIARIIPGGKIFLWIFKGTSALFKDFVTGIQNIKNCSFILIKNSSTKSWEETELITVGLVLGKQTVSIPGMKTFFRPKITVSIPPNPATGFLCFPHRDCILLLKNPRNVLVRLLVSFGVLGPEILNADTDQSLLDTYYK